MDGDATTRYPDVLQRLCDARGLFDLDRDHGRALPVPLPLDLYQLDDGPSP